jgi:hypothetical protein
MPPSRSFCSHPCPGFDATQADSASGGGAGFDATQASKGGLSWTTQADSGSI